MSRNHRIVHLVSLIAILISLFSPILTLPVLAQEATPVPDVSLTTDEDDPNTAADDTIELVETDPVEGPPAQDNPAQNDPPAAPTITAVVPAAPVITEATCGEGVVYAQTATAPVTEGVDYQIGPPDAVGNFTISATLTDALTYQWADTGLDGWMVDGTQATNTGMLALCPVPEPNVENETPGESGGIGEAKASTPAPDVPGEIPGSGVTGASTPAPEVPGQTKASTPKPGALTHIGASTPAATDKLAEPTIGRGPARASSMSSASNTDSGMSISMTADQTAIAPTGTIAYTITVTNNTPTDQHYSFTDVLPTGVSFVSATVPYPQLGDSCAPVAGTQNVTCGLADEMVLYPGWNDEWTIISSANLPVSNGCPDTILNTVTGSWDENNSASISIDVVLCLESRLALSITDNVPAGQSVRPGHIIEYSVSVTNTGSLPIPLFYMFHFTPLPPGTNVTGVTIENEPDFICDYIAATNSVSCQYSGLAPSFLQSQTHIISVRVDDAPPPEVCANGIQATVSGYEGNPLWSPTAGMDSVVTPLDCNALELSLNGPDTIDPDSGAFYAYIVWVTTTSTEPSGDFAFKLEIPPGIENTAMPAACSANLDGTVISCEGTSAAPLDPQFYRFEIKQSAAAEECSTVTATASGTSDNWIASSSSQSKESTFFSDDCETGLSLDVSADRTFVSPGDDITFSVSVTSPGLLGDNNRWQFQAYWDSNVFTLDSTAFTYSDGIECTINQNPFMILCDGQVTTVSTPTVVDIPITVRADLDPDVCQSSELSASSRTGDWEPASDSGIVKPVEISINCDAISLGTSIIGSGDVNEGSTFDYRVSVNQAGTVDTQDYKFTIPLPPGIDLASGTNSMDISFNVSCTPMRANGTTTINCEGPVNGSDHLYIFTLYASYGLNSAVCDAPISIPAAGIDGPWGDQNQHSSTVSVTCAPNLTLDFEADKAEAEPGDIITYTATIKNTEPFAEDEYHIDIGVPTGTVMQSIPEITSTGGAACNPVTQTTTLISCSGTDVQPDHVHTIQYTVQVTTAIDDALCTNGIQTSITEGTGDWDAGNPDSHTVSLLCPKLSISITDNLADDESVEMNGDLSFTYTVTNTGDSAIGDFSFVSTLPLRSMYNQSYPFGACVPSLIYSDSVETEVQCSGSEIPVGINSSVSFTVSVVPLDQSTNPSCGDVSTEVTGETGIWAVGGKSDTEHTFIECTSSFTLEAEPLQSSTTPGGTIGFKFTITNTGTVTTKDISLVLDDVLPSGDWNTRITADGVEKQPADLIFLWPNEKAVYTFESDKIPTDLTLPDNEWCKKWMGRATAMVDFNWGDDQEKSASAPVQVNCTGLSIVQEVSSDKIQPGGEVEYTVTVTNNGNTTAQNLVIYHRFTNVVKAFSNFTITSEDAYFCDTDPISGLACAFHTVGPRQSVSIIVTGDAPQHPIEQQCAPVTSVAEFYFRTANTAPLRSGGTPPLNSQVDCVSSFTFTNEALASPVIPGDTIGYELTVHNNGTLPISSLTLTPNTLPTLPTGVWIYTAALNDVSIDPNALPTLEPDDTLVYIVESSGSIPTDLTLPETEWCTDWTSSFTATVGFDWAAEQQQSDDATVQVNCTGLSVVQDVSSATIQPGDQVEYTITVTNDGNTTVAPLTVYHDITDTGTVFSNWSATATGATDCDLAMPTGAGCTFAALAPFESVQVIVTADAPLNPTIAQCAPISGAAAFTYTGLTTPIVSEPVTTQIDCQPAVDIALDGDLNLGTNNRVDADDTVTYTLTVTNSGNISLYGISIDNFTTGLEWDKPLTIAELLPEQSETFTATYTITQADIDAGFLETTISVQALVEPATAQTYLQVLGFASAQIAPVLPPSVGSDITERIDLPQEPAMQLDVSGVGTDEPGLGDTITYHYTVTNSGNVTLTDIEIVPDVSGLDFPDGTIATLAPGEEAVITGTYTVTQADVDTGSITMCADGIATDPESAAVNETDACITYQIAQPQPTVTPTPEIPATPEPTAPATPEVTATPEPTAPATPEVPATPDATPDASETPTATQEATQGVSGLPETGNGPGVITPIIWLAATIGVLALGIGGITIRRHR